jgi:hypothetical protein
MRSVVGVQPEQKRLQRGVRDGFAPDIMAWFPGHRPEADVAVRVVPWLASPAPQQPRHVIDNYPSFTQTQMTLSSTDADALIDLDTVCSRFFVQIAIAMVIGPIRRVFWTKRGTSLRPTAIFVESLIYHHLSNW